MSRENENQVTSGSLAALPEGVEGVDYKVFILLRHWPTIEFQVCSNCFTHLPMNNVMHELSCARRNWYCPDCKKTVLRNEKETHMEEFHSPVVCEWCGESVVSFPFFLLYFPHLQGEVLAS